MPLQMAYVKTIYKNNYSIRERHTNLYTILILKDDVSDHQLHDKNKANVCSILDESLVLSIANCVSFAKLRGITKLIHLQLCTTEYSSPIPSAEIVMQLNGDHILDREESIPRYYTPPRDGLVKS